MLNKINIISRTGGERGILEVSFSDYSFFTYNKRIKEVKE